MTPIPWTKKPYRRSAIPAAATIALSGGPRKARRPGGRSAPSRTAAIGGTRVARSAGRSAERSVITMPTIRLTTTVRVAKTVALFGRSMPIADMSLSRPTARPKPRKRPATAASAPTTSASPSTEAITWRRDAPIVRSVASSRIRCATVIEIVLKMTNAPTKSATPPKPSRIFWMIPTKPTSFVSCFTCAVTVRTCAVGGSSGRISAASLEDETFPFAATRTTSSLPTLLKSCCAVERSKTAIVAAPIDDTVPNFTIPETVKTLSGPRAMTRIVSPGL